MMIPQDQFIAARRRDWEELDQLISRPGARDGAEISRMSALYRSVCNDLAHAEASRYTPDMMAYLNSVAGRTHNVLYGPRPAQLWSAFRLVLVEFPSALRRNYKLFTLACLFFLVPWAVGLFGSLTSRAFTESVLPVAVIEQMEQAYSESLSRGRSESVDAGMAGFYVFNNIGIAFRCFATGIVFGLGSIYTLVYNGLIIGTTSGAIMAAGYGENIWTFMCGHGAFEIIAIFVSGGAGLQMGYSLVATDGLTRFGSLRRHARDIVAQVVGAGVMLLIAAAIEAFWSPSSAPHPVKWAVGAFNLLLVVGFLTFAGRSAKQPAKEGASP
jgi:uncharacterized membrane protein SpoIIM required for sporulation